MAELPLITILALEKANKNCYEKGLWEITNLQDSFTYHRKKENRNRRSRYVLLVPFYNNLSLLIVSKESDKYRFSLTLEFGGFEPFSPASRLKPPTLHHEPKNREAS